MVISAAKKNKQVMGVENAGVESWKPCLWGDIEQRDIEKGDRVELGGWLKEEYS